MSFDQTPHDGITSTDLGVSGLRRIELIRAALEMLSDPLRGVGPSNFAATFEGVPSIAIRPNEPIHNIYALVFVETGAVGLVLHLALWGSILWLGLGMIFRSERETARLAGALLGGLIGIAVWGLVTWLYRFHVVYTTFWILTGMLYGLSRVPRRTHFTPA